MTKVAIVTGTSSGLGLKTSILLAKQGYRVFATMRNPRKQKALLAEASEAGVSLDVLPLDVQSKSSVAAAVAQVVKEAGRIDVLVNNAGVGYARSTEQARDEDIRWVMDVNFNGVVRCTQAVLPSMRSQKSGHIINITSVGGLVGQPFNEFYCASKFAVEGYTESLATYVTDAFNIHFSLVEPGGISTEFFNSANKQIQASGGLLKDAYLPLLQSYLNGLRQRQSRGDARSFQKPEEVAAVVVACADNPNPPLRVRTSEWAKEFCRFKTSGDSDGSRQTKMVKEMYFPR